MKIVAILLKINLTVKNQLPSVLVHSKHGSHLFPRYDILTNYNFYCPFVNVATCNTAGKGA